MNIPYAELIPVVVAATSVLAFRVGQLYERRQWNALIQAKILPSPRSQK